MKIVQINATCGLGSTGKICAAVSDSLNERKIENYILFSAGESNRQNAIRYSNVDYIKMQALKSRVTGNYGFLSNYATKKLISHLEQIHPDIVHIHNIHSHDCNLETLCAYLKEKKVKVIWTFHDCWAFTGYCPHFSMVKCEKWKTGCHDCPQYKTYSWLFDKSEKLQQRKKCALEGLDLTIVTPSKWLKTMVEQSFLNDVPVQVINNGIDLAVFQPRQSDFREKHQLIGKKIVLGVAFDWSARKGLDVFVNLVKSLPSIYTVVLVGTDDKVDQVLPESIISLHRTKNQKELAEIYTAADVFVNPTREENYPTVNMEAIACGTPVVTFRTGGSPEMLDDSCGSVVECGDIDALKSEIVRICQTKPYLAEACVSRAKSFDRNARYEEYIDLYERTCCEQPSWEQDAPRSAKL